MQSGNPFDQGQRDYGNESDHDQSKSSARACQACRASKVRCIQPDESQPCVRCDKGGRQCLPTSNSNKRQKRNDDRSINQLEATLAALTSSLDRHGEPAVDVSTSRNKSIPSSLEANFDGTRTVQAGQSRPSPSPIETAIAEIIEEEIADTVFEEFITRMLPEFPFMAFPPDTSARDVCRRTPITFLAILDVAADGFCDLEASRRLRRLLVQEYSTRLLVTSEFSISILQALIISATWLKTIEPPGPGEQMEVYQISHAAANMAIIMGLGKAMKAQTWSGPMLSQAHNLRGPASQYQASSLDARRLWLSCHYICSK